MPKDTYNKKGNNPDLAHREKIINVEILVIDFKFHYLFKNQLRKNNIKSSIYYPKSTIKRQKEFKSKC